MMRLCLLVPGLVLLAAPAHAESRAAYVTMVLQAFAAKVECPGTDVVYQDLVQKAQEMHLPDGTTEWCWVDRATEIPRTSRPFTRETAQ